MEGTTMRVTEWDDKVMIEIEGDDLRQLARFCSTATTNGTAVVLTWPRGDRAHYEAHGWIGAGIQETQEGEAGNAI